MLAVPKRMDRDAVKPVPAPLNEAGSVGESPSPATVEANDATLYVLIMLFIRRSSATVLLSLWPSTSDRIADLREGEDDNVAPGSAPMKDSRVYMELDVDACRTKPPPPLPRGGGERTVMMLPSGATMLGEGGKVR
jgi:hypothetical protein